VSICSLLPCFLLGCSSLDFNSVEAAIRLRTSDSTVDVAANALADVLVTFPFPLDISSQVVGLIYADADATGSPVAEVMDQAYWTGAGETSGAISLLRFIGEFKPSAGEKNRNQLLIDFGTGQCQQRALGITQTIWGGTCSAGIVAIYSSNWNLNSSVECIIFSCRPVTYGIQC
jgi:hypothetical protein